MSSMLKSYGNTARTVVVVLLVVAVGGAVARQARLLDRHFIFFPDRDLGATPAEVGLDYEDVRIGVGTGEKLHGWFVPGDRRTTLLWLHGNAGNIGGRLDNLRMLHDALGLSVLIFDYRGYGQSGGVPSEAAMYEDAEAALEFLRSDKGLDPGESIVLFGRSLGGAVAVETAARHHVRGIVLESAFTSVRDMARRTHPNLPSSLVMRMIESRFDALSRIPDVHSPVLILHGDQDDLVPADHARRLFDAAAGPKSLYLIEGASHNDTYLVGGAPYFDALRAFIDNPGEPR